ncbi:MAG TPA: hypothetical protein VF618_02225 [Thermoanaerobaculia bacterium]
MSIRLFDRAHARWLFVLLICACGGVPLHLSMKNNASEERGAGRADTKSGRFAAQTLSTTGVQVYGRLALQPTAERGADNIELPDIDVTLQDASNGTTVATAKTELDGKFRLRSGSSGTFRVCWSAGGIGSGCGATFQTGSGTHLLGQVPIRGKAGVVYGKALTRDGRPCWITDAFFQLDVYTKVSLLDGAGNNVQPAIRANWQGEYAFGGLGSIQHFVRAECEKSAIQLAVPTTSLAQVNLTLPNRAPRIGGVAAFDAASFGLTRAPVGATIRVNAEARDPENDAIEYLWRTADGTVVTGGNSPQQQWTLASAAGLHTLYLMARDGKGGYAYKRFDIPSGATKLNFSGTVIDETTQLAVAGASVSIGTVTTTTNSRGWFRLAVPPMPRPERYVLNVRHGQYSLLSRIHDKESVGQTYELTQAQVTNVDPSLPINLLDSNSAGPCGVRTQSGEQTQCRHRGARVIIPPGALVDAEGKTAVAPVRVALTTLNPARRALPGDYRAVDRNGETTELLSFGAANVDLRSATGQPLNLRPGVNAELRVPVSDLQRPSAPAIIPLWSYDEDRGLWIEEGQATLQNTAEGWMYVGKTPHFSTLNMDISGNDVAQSTCVRLELGSSLAGWTNLVLRAYVSYAGTSLQVKETALDNQQYHAIYRIPYSPPAAGPNTLRLELRGTYNGTTVVLLNNIINTDARPQMTGTNLFPPYPYTECGVPILLEADPVNLPYYGDINATGLPSFLTGPNGQFNPSTGAQDAIDYYNTIDPGNLTNPTLSQWWTNHGFSGVDGSGGDASAAYLNFNDLGFGRNMNCKVTGADLACFVTNYGLPDQNLANADAAELQDPAQRGATVAMEYIASEPADRRVRFYVYAPGNPATAGKLEFADLDGLGPKPVPHLCVVCHGGSYDSTAQNVVNARFREFDLPSFKYSSARSWDFSGPNNFTLTNPELTNFTLLNKMVRDISPGTPIQALIDAWYTTGYVGAKKPVLPTPPAGWSGQVAGYHNVYAQSCRTCHVARDAPFDFTFGTSGSFASTEYAVCGSPKVMPNAYVTYKNFWSDTQRVIDYTALTSAGTCQ